MDAETYDELIGNLEDWRKAGKIAAQALEYGKGLIKKGASLLEVSELIEKKISELGGKPAFPVQISCDHIAAHYCAEPDDKIIFDNQLACLDVGVHVDGAIGDNACTVDLSGQWTELVKASRDALDNAIKACQIGVNLGQIGKIIHDTIASYGFSPIKNLSGHGLSRFNIHDHPTIPNYDNGNNAVLEKGMIIAIEPFATNGMGAIYETDRANIFSMIAKKPVRNMMTRQVLKEIENYEGLPFTTRWLTKKFPLGKVNIALRELKTLEMIRDYPPLPDKAKGMVSQAENTLLIGDKVEILTKP
jgi:methionyl aminopeptidase